MVYEMDKIEIKLFGFQCTIEAWGTLLILYTMIIAIISTRGLLDFILLSVFIVIFLVVYITTLVTVDFVMNTLKKNIQL